MSTRDEVKLSVHERQKLARMQATLQAADPRLARVLRHDAALEPDGPPPAWRHSRRRSVGKLVRVWVGVIVATAGLALMPYWTGTIQTDEFQVTWPAQPGRYSEGCDDSRRVG